jgi:hypothetical protein
MLFDWDEIVIFHTIVIKLRDQTSRAQRSLFDLSLLKQLRHHQSHRECCLRGSIFRTILLRNEYIPILHSLYNQEWRRVFPQERSLVPICIGVHGAGSPVQYRKCWRSTLRVGFPPLLSALVTGHSTDRLPEHMK